MLDSQLETHFFQANQVPTQVTTAGQFFKLTSIPSGSAEKQRTGDNIIRKFLEFKYTITVGATGLIAAADQYNTVRVIVFSWKADDGVYNPTAISLLDSAATPQTIASLFYDDKRNFTVHYDKSHVVFNTPYWNGAAVTWSHGVGGTFETPEPIRIPLKGKIEFNSDFTYGTNHLYAMFVSDSAFSPNPTCAFSSTFAYTDA